MNENKALERGIVRAFFESAQVVDENIRWRRYRLNGALLRRHLRALSGSTSPFDFVTEMSKRLGLNVLRVDPLKLRIYGFERSFDRQSIAEGLGSVGVQFFPTRQSAMRSASEAAREVVYFAAGPVENQFLECPFSRILSVLCGTSSIPERCILRDLREGFESNETIYRVLEQDVNFTTKIRDDASLEAFEHNLRTNPMSPEFIDKCSNFFNRRATIGVRDTMRWMLGSRHPWFGWDHARELLDNAFEKTRECNFNTPQMVYYAYDPAVSEAEIEDAQTHNACVVERFAGLLRESLTQEMATLASKLADNLSYLARWILDIHHDYPDFDLEAKDSFGPGKHFDFLGHSIQNTMNKEFLGEVSKMRLNRNMRAHFEARGLDRECLKDLTPEENERFFAVLDEVLTRYDRDGGIEGLMYQRIPCILFTLQDLGEPQPREGERLLDAFDLSRMTELEHASYMRMFPEISEKLAVFFALTLRHMLDTEHVPDLQPRNFAKDFLLLGLWGTRTPNIRINLYVSNADDERNPVQRLQRCEIRFVGLEQVETHPLSHIRDNSKALRFAVMHLVPLIEPSILRNLGTFTMAMEEFRDSSHSFDVEPLSLMHYGLDMLRETARCGVKGAVTDAMSMFEYLVDSTTDSVQRQLDKTAKKLEKKKKK